MKSNDPRNEQTKAAQTAELLRAVTEAYLQTGEAQTAEQLAARLGWTVQAVRRRLSTESGFLIDGVQHGAEREREVANKNYPVFGTGRYYAVKTYLPTLRHLREVVISARDALYKYATRGD